MNEWPEHPEGNRRQCRRASDKENYKDRLWTMYAMAVIGFSLGIVVGVWLA